MTISCSLRIVRVQKHRLDFDDFVVLLLRYGDTRFQGPEVLLHEGEGVRRVFGAALEFMGSDPLTKFLR